MRKVLGLAMTTVLLLAYTSCTDTSQKQINATPTASTATPTPATTTPTPAGPTPTTTATPTTTVPTTATVKGSNFKWQDDVSGTPVTTIKVGGTVTWTIVSPGGGRHRLRGAAPSPANGCDQQDASFDSGDLTAGQSASRTFTKVGTFGYLCGIHGGTPKCNTPPGDGTMPGVIKVVP